MNRGFLPLTYLTQYAKKVNVLSARNPQLFAEELTSKIVMKVSISTASLSP